MNILIAKKWEEKTICSYFVCIKNVFIWENIFDFVIFSRITFILNISSTDCVVYFIHCTLYIIRSVTYYKIHKLFVEVQQKRKSLAIALCWKSFSFSFSSLNKIIFYEITTTAAIKKEEKLFVYMKKSKCAWICGMKKKVNIKERNRLRNQNNSHDLCVCLRIHAYHWMKSMRMKKICESQWKIIENWKREKNIKRKNQEKSPSTVNCNWKMNRFYTCT